MAGKHAQEEINILEMKCQMKCQVMVEISEKKSKLQQEANKPNLLPNSYKEAIASTSSGYSPRDMTYLGHPMSYFGSPKLDAPTDLPQVNRKTSPAQTAAGKDETSPLMAVALPKSKGASQKAQPRLSGFNICDPNARISKPGPSVSKPNKPQKQASTILDQLSKHTQEINVQNPLQLKPRRPVKQTSDKFHKPWRPSNQRPVTKEQLDILTTVFNHIRRGTGNPNPVRSVENEFSRLNKIVKQIFINKRMAHSNEFKPIQIQEEIDMNSADQYVPGFQEMDDTQSVATLIEFKSTKTQQLQQAFAELESHRTVPLNLKWKELEEHFHGLERSLKRRFSDVENQEKEYETKATKAREMLEKHEAMVVAKENASLERPQKKRDSALSAIGVSFDRKRKEPEPISTNSTSIETIDPVVAEKAELEGSANEDKLEEANETTGDRIVGIEPQSELIKLCKEMDVEGLHKFVYNRKNLAAIREKVPLALKSASDPILLVLNSLEDFYCETMSVDGKTDPNLLGLRRTCIMLMECLAPMLSNSDSEALAVTKGIREKAREIATEWKPKLYDLDASTGNSLEVHAFLQLLATFDIASEFNKAEICELIPSVACHRQTSDLCHILQLEEKMPGVIEVLVSSGRQIKAVNMAYAFDLTKQFEPVPLLKAYLKDVRKASQAKAGNISPSSAENEANERECSALKAVIKCIEEHKLEDQYPVDALQKRVLQLEKAKADKKRVVESAKPQPKRPRANTATNGLRPTNTADKSFYRSPDRYPYMHVRP